eukprot:m.518073 g.518073  ORF g.518073 m.518073 type:complete len:69 (-) comp57483_c0_seq23:1442-1648(-)
MPRIQRASGQVKELNNITPSSSSERWSTLTVRASNEAPCSKRVLQANFRLWYAASINGVQPNWCKVIR